MITISSRRRTVWNAFYMQNFHVGTGVRLGQTIMQNFLVGPLCG
jgi:hypothetical protein